MASIHSIWDYPQVLGETVSENERVSLGEGETDLQLVGDIYIKREDQNPTGSVKDRGTSYQISVLKSQGYNHFVLPSSGNGAISAAKYCQSIGARFSAIVSQVIDKTKLTALAETNAEIIFDSQPTKFAHRYAINNNAINLRPSTSDIGTVGYRTLAPELYKQLGQVPGSIFFPVSSGTTLVGAYEGFELIDMGKPQFFAIQTSAIHPISGSLDDNFNNESSSLATGIVARAVPRKNNILEIIEDTIGGGVVVDNSQISDAYQWLHSNGINSSFDGAVSVAGAWEKLIEGNVNRPIVCLVTGKDR